MMDSSTIWSIVLVLVVVVSIWNYIRKTTPRDESFIRLYSDVLNSDEYKVKGRFED